MADFALADYSARKRHDLLWLALDGVLQDLKQSEGTATIAELLRLLMKFPSSELPMTMTWLKKVAPLVPEAAQTGAVVKAYGRLGRRWVWSPRLTGTALLRAAVEDRRSGGTVVDTRDW